MSWPRIEPVTSRSPERTLYQLSYRGRCLWNWPFISKPHAHLHSMQKTSEKFQNNWWNAPTRYPLYFHLWNWPFRWKYSGYLVGAFHQLFWNFSDVFCMEWRCACGLDIILWLFFLTFSFLWTVFPRYEMLWAQLLLLFFTDCFETLQMFSAWNDVHVILV